MDESTLALFLSKVQVLPNGCWRWAGETNDQGYGIFRRKRAHRTLFEHFVGPIPKGVEPDHTCHSNDAGCPGGSTCPHRACVNWAHLELVTRRVNNLRGRSPSAANARKTHCEHGHPFDSANTYITPAGHRQCRACRAERTHTFQVTKRRKGPRPRPATCPQGHPYEGDNVAFTKTGAIRCRQCARERERSRAALKRAENPPKGRQPKTHCKWGHELTPENTYWTQDGRRQCRECSRRAVWARRARKRREGISAGE